MRGQQTPMHPVRVAPCGCGKYKQKPVGKRIIICDGADAARLWGQIGAGEREELTWVPRDEEARARPPGFRVLPGGLCAEAFQKLDPTEDDEFAIVTEDGPFLRAAVQNIAKQTPEAPILVLSDRLGDDELPNHPSLRRTGLRSLIRDDVDEEFTHLANLHRVVAFRKLLEPRERIAILLQPDPDPDGIGGGLAARAILGRKRSTAPLVSFGEVTRPENRAMVQALGAEVRKISVEELNEFDALVLIDVQPTVFGANIPARLRSVDVVIDHHPEQSGYDAVIRDIRTAYGATSTILTEYLRAAELELRAKLATALLYGIKSDTQLLGRETSRRDMHAFAFLHACHSPALLRRIEQPALPQVALHALGRALAQSQVEQGIHLLVLGRVADEVIPQVADLALLAEGAEWAIAAGIVKSDLVFSVRNVGYVRAAGDIVKSIVEGMGVGGGHRSMAKGIIPLKAFREVHGAADQKTIRRVLLSAFAQAIHESA